jgi:sulfur relay (sulfurtransferase) DsrF/TusC family protein
MKPRVLFIVTGDPRSSTRPAEAVRIAAGVSAWQKADITVYLRDTAVLALGESSGVLMEEENYARYWPMLAESGQPIYVQKNASSLAKLGEAAVPFTEISDDQLAQLAAEQTYVMRF